MDPATTADECAQIVLSYAWERNTHKRAERVKAVTFYSCRDLQRAPILGGNN